VAAMRFDCRRHFRGSAGKKLRARPASYERSRSLWEFTVSRTDRHGQFKTGWRGSGGRKTRSREHRVVRPLRREMADGCLHA